MRQNNFRKNWYIHAGFIAIILGIVIYNLPYFAEMREFGNVEKAYKSGNIHAIQAAAEKYARKYPNGKHIEEVMFMPVKANKSEGPIALLDAVDWYLEAHPKGIYAKECTAISDSIWNVEITKYENEAEKNASKEGAKFIIEMLHYMRDNKIRTIEVLAEPTLNLKEYSDYPADMRQYLESVPSEGVKLPDDLVTIKDKVTIEKARGWIQLVINSLEGGFNEVFTKNFIKFKIVNETEGERDKKFPLVKVAYTVNTNELPYGIPDIWVKGHTEEDGLQVAESLILAIGINFESTFTLPGKSVNYTISGVGNPGLDEIQGDIDECYEEMCLRSMQYFANKIIVEFGFKPITIKDPYEEYMKYMEELENQADTTQNIPSTPKQFE